MAMPGVLEPAFIVNNELGVDATSSPNVGPKDYPNGYLTSSPDSARSTSAGSGSPIPSTKEGEIESPTLPDYDYPVPLFVRNTFIDADVVRPISLDDFYESRRVHSCPVESPPGLCSDFSDPGFAAMHYPVPMPPMPPLPMMDSVYAAAMHASAAAAAAAACWMPNMGMQPPMSPMSPMSPMHQQLAGSPFPQVPVPPGMEPPVLRLVDALAVAEPELGSPQCPTIGSANHRLGNCKPCAFFHTKGCGNGTQCPFCHLCNAGEKKRRQKERGVVQRDMKRFGLMPEF